MTRTEAIDLLDNLIGMVDDNHESDYDTALDMAIKALEYDDAKYHEEHGEVIVDKAVWEDAKRALEQEPSGDAISRDFQIGDEVRIIGSDPIYDDCDVGWVIRNASERVKTMYVMRNDGSAEEENKEEWYKTGRHNTTLAEVIKALPSVKPQPCEDAVSREAVDDILCLYSDGNGMIDAGGAVRMVRELPSVNPQEPKWIPCSERLPEKDDLYLICFDDGEYDLVYFCKGAFSYSGVIAWMPLPEPYTAESEDK